jgi:hypothetical protein
MSSSTGLAPRRRTAYAAKQAAKQKRQRNIAIGGLVLLVIIGIYEVPHTLKLLNHKSSAPPVSVAPVTTPTAPTVAPTGLKGLPKTGPDPFIQSAITPSDPGIGAAIGGRDPFEHPTAVVTPTVQVSTQQLPEKIVIGSPGGGRIAQHGWIVILASIPTDQGRSAANSFASRATQAGVSGLSILNSSNRKPLRGGYWVVYAGPYETLAQVTARASAVHAAGYGTAYIRELIVYR